MEVLVSIMLHRLLKKYGNWTNIADKTPEDIAGRTAYFLDSKPILHDMCLYFSNLCCFPSGLWSLVEVKDSIRISYLRTCEHGFKEDDSRSRL